MQASNTIEQLRNLFAQQANIELALLIGSRAVGRAREDSDWDFAVQWRWDIPWENALEYTETLRADLARLLQKAKHLLKAAGQDIPVSAYDAFVLLADIGQIPREQINDRNRAIGLRNRIVHDYMNIRMDVILDLVRNEQYGFIADFLLKPIDQAE